MDCGAVFRRTPTAWNPNRTLGEDIGGQVERLAEMKLFGLSLMFYFAVLVVILAQLVLTRTVFGRYMIAIGTNEEAVR